MTAPPEPSPPGSGSPDRGDDSAIIQQSWREPECFAVLFRRHAPALARYVTRRLGRDAADDVVAETFLAAFRQRDRYDLTHPDARPWLYGIATHLIGRHQRAEIRQYRLLARTGTDPVTESFTDRVDDAVTAGRLSRVLAAELARLPRGHRDVLLLVAWGDLSYPQVAEALGVPVGTVRSRLSRARQALRLTLSAPDAALASEPAGRHRPRSGLPAALRRVPTPDRGAAAPAGGSQS